MEQQEFVRVKANWLPLDKTELDKVLEQVLQEVTSTQEELLLRYATDPEQMKQVLEGRYT